MMRAELNKEKLCTREGIDVPKDKQFSLLLYRSMYKYNVLNFTRSCKIQLMQWCYFCSGSLMYRQLPSRRKLPSDADIHSLLKILNMQYCIINGSR
jgi:hypothetical protein